MKHDEWYDNGPFMAGVRCLRDKFGITPDEDMQADIDSKSSPLFFEIQPDTKQPWVYAGSISKDEDSNAFAIKDSDENLMYLVCQNKLGDVVAGAPEKLEIVQTEEISALIEREITRLRKGLYTTALRAMFTGKAVREALTDGAMLARMQESYLLGAEGINVLLLRNKDDKKEVDI